MIRDRSGKPVFAYSRGASTDGRGRKSTRKNDDPEHRFQCAVADYLTFAMPKGYLWTADAAGVRVGMQTAIKMKAAGVHRGWPDVRILFPSAVTRFIELKAKDGRLSPDQIAFREFCENTGRDIWAMARTLEEVEAALVRWRVPLLAPLAKANRYGAGV